MVPSARTKSNRHKLKNRKFYLNTKKSCFTVRVVEHRSRLLREVAVSPSLELLKAQLDMALTNLLPLTVLRAGGE